MTLLVSGACADAGSLSAPPEEVAAVPVHSIEISAATGVLERGRTVQFTAIPRDAAGAPLTGRSLAWSSSAPTIASVDGAGVVRGLAAGEATISVAAEGKSADVTLAVRDTASLPTILSGSFRRMNLHLAAGRTYHVTGDLTVMADSALTIDADLVMSPGVSVALYGRRSLRITGNIVADTMAGAASRGRPAALVAYNNAAEGTEELVLGGENRIELIGKQGDPKTHRPYGPIYIAGEGAETDLTIKFAFIEPRRAPAGTQSSRRGEDGYALHIGSPSAQRKAQEKFGRPAAEFRTITVDGSTVSAGDGGPGYSIMARSDGYDSNNRWDGVSGDGGKGGLLLMRARDLLANKSVLEPGQGGRGGDIILVGEQALRDGSGPRFEGESMSAATGSGGQSGDLSVAVQRVFAHDRFQAPRRASPGTAEIVGGNGARGGKGGDLKLAVGDTGTVGEITVSAPIKVADPVRPALGPNVAFRKAANGGDSPSPTQEGGSGGTITVASLLLAGDAHVAVVTFAASANGGLGFNGCAAAQLTNGSNGGGGGARKSGKVPVEDDDSFNGARGGDGLRVTGKGGPQGLDHATGDRIGRRGTDGANCKVGARGRISFDGYPVDATVEFSDGTNTWAAKTDALGDFALVSLLAGAYLVRVIGQPSWMECPAQEVDLAAELVTVNVVCFVALFTLLMTDSHRHFSGFSEVCLIAAAGAKLAGAPYRARLTGAGVAGSGTFEGQLDELGEARLQSKIFAYGVYNWVLTVLVRYAGREFEVRTGTTSRNVGPGGDSCTLPAS